jgi:DNA modification methylase
LRFMLSGVDGRYGYNDSLEARMPSSKANSPSAETTALIRQAARDQSPVQGTTHRFYRYPARFSPTFARACINAFTQPGDIVLDPYMGGGTTVVEAHLLGRRAIGSDLNSLAVFVARAKVSALSSSDVSAITLWATVAVPSLRCTALPQQDMRRPKNMALPSVRWLRKTISLALYRADAELPSAEARDFARCIILNVGQWALNGRKRATTAGEFRTRITSTALEMLAGASELADSLRGARHPIYQPLLRLNDAEQIDRDRHITSVGRVDLVVTSPPYPGIHMLYHRWQVDGRKETDAPYWIAACNDGQGSSFYNFADRKEHAHDRYFAKATCSFAAVRRLMRPGAVLVQMVAFSRPDAHLSRYLDSMSQAGFRELRAARARRAWRSVPGRKWHAHSKGDTPSAREVVLLHEAC